MTSLPQTRQRKLPAQDGCRRAWPATTATAPEFPGSVRARARQNLPAVDPSTVYGCVDWFLYPDESASRVAADA
jgi:hypothetical protein